jgi:hypothetical protein
VAAAFGGYLLWTHRGARELVAREETVLARLRELAVAPERRPHEESGYRFAWIIGHNLPDLLVAQPLRRGEHGVRWFVTSDGKDVFQFDTVLFRAHGHLPDLDALRRYLILTPAERAARELPVGWQTAE